MADNINIQRPYKGMFVDCSLIDQPKDTYRYALNAVNINHQGEENFLFTEASTKRCLMGQDVDFIVGKIPMQEDSVALLGTIDGHQQIAILHKEGNIETIVSTPFLDFDERYPIRGTYRLKRNNERVIYWVDDKHKPKYFNFDRLYDFYTESYLAWLEGNKATSFGGAIWDINKFDLIRGYEFIPEFIKTEVIDGGGRIDSGSYNIAVQLVDSNLNATEWITISDTVNIFVDSLKLEYSEIRGSKNTSSIFQAFPKANKSIRWTIANIDPSFSYFRVAVLQATAGDGKINKALVSSLISSTSNTFTYSGNDEDFTLTAPTDIQVSRMDISSAAYIEQLENRLIIAGIKGKQINYCDFQRKASVITAKLVTKYVLLEDVEGKGNPKNPIQDIVGYMPGEVYSFGIIYVSKDGTESPVFHIPGRPSDISNTGMDYYECPDNKYIPLHTCMENEYWGSDRYGNTLIDNPIRHHRFPYRTEPLYKTEVTTEVLEGFEVKAQALFKFEHDYNPAIVPDIYYNIHVAYKVNNVSTEYVEQQLGSFILNNTSYLITLGYYPEGTLIYVNPYGWVELNGDYNTDTTENKTDYHFPKTKTTTKTLTQIYGINFDNIEKPNADIIGYRIVRNKREENDKLIVDNVLLGPLMNTDFNAQANPYHSFGLLCPSLGTDQKLSDKSFYIFSPEHQFYNKKLSFNKIIVTGEYERTAKFLPNDGVLIQDVKAGSTFDSRYDKGEPDPDGFSLSIAYRVNTFKWQYTTAVIHTDTDSNSNPIKETYYLSAAGSKTDSEGNTFFNASMDNKIIIPVLENGIDSSVFGTKSTPKLLTASLKQDNTTAYANFINRVYYREHQNMFTFQSSFEKSLDIFNGDTFVTSATIVSSTYYDTKIQDPPKKNKVWKIVVGAVLIAAAAVATVFSFGTASPLLVAAIGMAVSYGISTLTSGIQFETMKNMIDADYEQGLKITLEDENNKDGAYQTNDDRFCWFADRLQNIYFESSVNMAVRSGTTINTSDFVNSPSPVIANFSTTSGTASRQQFDMYLTNKLTIIDRENNDGRLYIGFAAAEFYDINLDFLRKKEEKSHYYLPIEYECCSNTIETYRNRVHYSEQSYQEEKADNFRSFLPNNYRDVEGETGKITNIFRLNNSLFIHTEEAVYQLPQNLQERVTQELVSFIGTGEFFSIPPKRLESKGSHHPEATVKTPFGVVYTSMQSKMVGIISEQNLSLSENGMDNWFKEHLVIEMYKFLTDLGYDYSLFKNTQSKYGVGIHAAYDNRFSRLLLTKIDYLPIQAFMTANTELNDTYKNSQLLPEDGTFVFDPYTATFGYQRYATAGNYLMQGYVQAVPLSTPQYFENKSWTISFSFKTKSWTSFHSYLPYFYIATENYLYSLEASSNRGDLWMHNTLGSYLKFYGSYYSHIIEYVSLSSPVTERIWNDLTLQTNAQKYLPVQNSFILSKDVFFTNIIFYNSRQCSPVYNIVLKENLAANYNTFMMEQIQDVTNRLIAENSLGKWNMNGFEDLVVDDTVPLFLKDWDSIKNSYPIDKVANPSAISLSKDWTQVENFRDKYLCIRLIFDNFAGNENVELATNYSFESEQPSI